MNYLILLFGILIALGGTMLLARSEIIFGLLAKHVSSVELHVFSIVIRAVLGIALVMAAPESRFPLALQVVGWISIAAALLLAGIGRGRFQNLIGWALELGPPFKRLAGILVVLFGGFLIYAVL